MNPNQDLLDVFERHKEPLRALCRAAPNMSFFFSAQPETKDNPFFTDVCSKQEALKCPECHTERLPPLPLEARCVCLNDKTESKCINNHKWHWHPKDFGEEVTRVWGPSKSWHVHQIVEGRPVTTYADEICTLCTPKSREHTF